MQAQRTRTRWAGDQELLRYAISLQRNGSSNDEIVRYFINTHGRSHHEALHLVDTALGFGSVSERERAEPTPRSPPYHTLDPGQAPTGRDEPLGYDPSRGYAPEPVDSYALLTDYSTQILPPLDAIGGTAPQYTVSYEQSSYGSPSTSANQDSVSTTSYATEYGESPSRSHTSPTYATPFHSESITVPLPEYENDDLSDGPDGPSGMPDNPRRRDPRGPADPEPRPSEPDRRRDRDRDRERRDRGGRRRDRDRERERREARGGRDRDLNC